MGGRGASKGVTDIPKSKAGQDGFSEGEDLADQGW